jgi:hypothetical protein
MYLQMFIVILITTFFVYQYLFIFCLFSLDVFGLCRLLGSGIYLLKFKELNESVKEDPENAISDDLETQNF